MKRNTREYHNQNDSQGIYQNSIVRDYNNKNDCKGAFLFTEMPENTKIKRTAKTNTTREYHNQKNYIGVLQTKVLPGSVKKDCQRV